MKNKTTLTLILAILIAAPTFASVQNSNNSDTIYNQGDTHATTNNNNTAYNMPSASSSANAGSSSHSYSNANSASNSNATGGVGVGYGGTGVGVGGNSNAKGGNATANAEGGNSNATGGKGGNANGTNTSSGNVNNTITSETNIPRNAPAAVAPSMVGAIGTNSYSGGVSTLLGGVSVGKSTTTREGKELLKAQTAKIDIENLKELNTLDSMDAEIIRRSILRRYR